MRILLFVLLLVSFASAQEPKKAPQAVVSGQVRAASTDAKGNILTLEIMVGDEGSDQEPYQVVPSTDPKKPSVPFEELKQLVGEWIVAAGYVSEDKLGWKTIVVRKILPADYAKPQQ